MRMIVDAFKDTLELGLEKPKQVVVRFSSFWTQPLRLEAGDRLSAIPPPSPDKKRASQPCGC